jgi:hypothetical protein
MDPTVTGLLNVWVGDLIDESLGYVGMWLKTAMKQVIALAEKGIEKSAFTCIEVDGKISQGYMVDLLAMISLDDQLSCFPTSEFSHNRLCGCARFPLLPAILYWPENISH